jgi:hypothetical protein
MVAQCRMICSRTVLRDKYLTVNSSGGQQLSELCGR